MTNDRMALLDALQKADDGNFLRALAETVLQILMEADVEGVIGAGRYERSGERTTWRNGYRERTLDTRLGPLNLKIPKLRTGSYFPPFLEARKTAERALVAVIQEAWIAASRPGASMTSCRPWGFMRNALAHVPKGQHTVAAAAIRQTFLQPDHTSATQTWRHVADQLRGRWPKLGTLMDEAEVDVLAYLSFPAQHRTKLHSTNPLERLNKEVKRRADVVGIF